MATPFKMYVSCVVGFLIAFQFSHSHAVEFYSNPDGTIVYENDILVFNGITAGTYPVDAGLALSLVEQSEQFAEFEVESYSLSSPIKTSFGETVSHTSEALPLTNIVLDEDQQDSLEFAIEQILGDGEISTRLIANANGTWELHGDLIVRLSSSGGFGIRNTLNDPILSGEFTGSHIEPYSLDVTGIHFPVSWKWSQRLIVFILHLMEGKDDTTTTTVHVRREGRHRTAAFGG